ncbi:hypothetical protein ACFYUV_20755 [Nonomuraea sp. NPDC003560]|uniref:hypothetical protein n=1 Tax=Nonomuraea sp. NPDC003560 TaxID=3364341 RepID=UPI00369CE9C7
MNDEILNSLSDGTFRARWLREVLRTVQITESVKVLLISMGVEEMDPAGRVSVPRKDLAVRIGRSPARVTDRITEAIAGGFLVRLSAGKKSNTAVYAAAIKGSACPDLIDDVSEEGKGSAARTQSEHFGSDLQAPLAEEKGPPTRTETMFGSDLQAPLESDEVRLGGPIAPIKGSAKRATKVVGGVGEEVPHTSEDEEDFLIGEAAARPARKRAKASATPKTSIPADFAVDDDMRAWALENCPLVNIVIETQLFVRYWLERPQKKRPGWVKSWESWMLRQQGWAEERQSNVRQLRPPGTVATLTRSTTDDRVAQAQALKAKFAARQTHPAVIQGEIS